MPDFLPSPAQVTPVEGILLVEYTTSVEGVSTRIFELHHPTAGLIARDDPASQDRGHANGLATLAALEERR